jgi:uncharacterized protein (TIGR02217 family)
MAFLEVELPRPFSLLAVGGPTYATTVNSGFSGYEQRNQNWSESRGEWDVVFVGQKQPFYDTLQAFFHAVRGKANGFRLYWPADFSATAQFIGTGDSATEAFQLQKTYTFAANPGMAVVRPIQKPIMSEVVDYNGNHLTDTVVAYITRNGVTNLASFFGIATSVDAETGVMTLTPAPNSAAYNTAHGYGTLADIITADFQFHWPVRFDNDKLQPKLVTPQYNTQGILYTIDGIKLMEVRIPLGGTAG